MKKQGNTVIKILFTITAANLLGKVLGFFKDILMSYYYGTSEMTDAYFLAVSIPTIIIGIFTSATDSAIVPQYNRIMLKNGRDKADRLFSTIINLICSIALVISVTMLLCPKWFVYAFAPKFGGIQVKYACYFLQIFSFCGLFHILYCFFCTYNTIYSRTTVRAILSFSTNLVVVLALIIWHDENMIGVSMAFLLSSVIAAVLPLINALRIGYRYQWNWCIKDVEMKNFYLIFIPIMGAALLADINQYIDKFLVSSVVGGISSLNYASRLTSIFDSMLVVGLGVILLPKLSQLNALENKKEFVKITSYTTKWLVMFLLPIAVISIVLHQEIIEVIYRRGQFGLEALKSVSIIFLCYAPGILLLPLQATLAKVFHSMENTKTPLKINLVVVSINIVLSIILFHILGVKGVALGTTVSVAIGCIIYHFTIKKSIGWSSDVFGSSHVLKILSISFLALLFMSYVKNYILNIYVRVLVIAILGVIIFVIGYILLLKDDVKEIWTRLFGASKR